MVGARPTDSRLSICADRAAAAKVHAPATRRRRDEAADCIQFNPAKDSAADSSAAAPAM